MPRFGSRRYKLQFDDRPAEFVNANSPTEAVALRAGGRASRVPHTMTDMTAMSTLTFRATRAGYGRAPDPSTPLLDRIYGRAEFTDDGWDSPRWPSKVLA